MTDNDTPFFNRELSWLQFNRRVLEQALDPSLPPLERLRFLAITSSNLDEFFMVRVGGLHQLLAQRREEPDASGMTPAAQLAAIRKAVLELTERQYACWRTELEPALVAAQIRRVPVPDLNAEQKDFVDRLFTHELFPVITSVALVPDRPFPLLPGLGLNLLARLAPARGGGEKSRFAVIALPRSLPRFITLPAPEKYNYIHLEDVVTAHIGRMFPGEPVLEIAPFRVARNADLRLADDDAEDLLADMKEVLSERRQSHCIRLEIPVTASPSMLDCLRQAMALGDDDIYPVDGPLDLAAYFRLAAMPGFQELKTETWPPQPVPEIGVNEPVFNAIARQDLLLLHPYESFDPVVRLLEEAAEDPYVLAIKQILYRTSERSPVVAALMRAAERGKHVTVLVELKARFDEERNIEWAGALERVGAQVIYGLRGLKVHAKCCLIVRREPQGIRRYVHFGTGNYNEKTARLYSDLSFMSCGEEYGSDASLFFNAITGYSQPVKYGRMETAPLGLLDRLLELIANETERQKQGQPGHIMAKVNSLGHPRVIEALYAASRAGVRVQLNVRGICCLRPGLPKWSKTIEVVSIVDHFLEHSRILYFRNGGRPLLFISSADWMPRNLDRRVETLVAVEHPALQKRLIHILETYFRDNQQAWQLQPDGEYRRLQAEEGRKRTRSQRVLYQEACRAAERAQQSRSPVFQPQRPAPR